MFHSVFSSSRTCLGRSGIALAMAVLLGVSGCTAVPNSDLTGLESWDYESRLSDSMSELRSQQDQRAPFAVTNRGMQIEKNLGF